MYVLILRSQSKGCVPMEMATLIKYSGSGSFPIKYILQGAHPIDLVNGVQSELAPPGEPYKLVRQPACIIKEGGCVDLSMDTMHLKDPLVLFGHKGSALTLPLFSSFTLLALSRFFNDDQPWKYLIALNGLCVSMCI